MCFCSSYLTFVCFVFVLFFSAAYLGLLSDNNQKGKTEITEAFYGRHKIAAICQFDHVGATETILIIYPRCVCLCRRAERQGASGERAEHRHTAGTESELLVPRGAHALP